MNPSYNAGGIYSSGADAPEISAPAPSAPMSLGGSGRSGGGAKKWILIAGGVLIVVLIVVLVVFAVMPRGGGGSVSVGKALSDVTNYMMLGTTEPAQDAGIANFNPNTNDPEFVYATADVTYGAQQEFFNKSLEYIDILKNALGNGNSANNDVAILKDDVVMLKELAGLAYSGSLLTMYLDGGAAELGNYAKQIDTLSLNNSDNYNDLLLMMKSATTESAKFYQKYTDAGCIQNQTLNDECVDNLFENNSEIVNMQNDLTKIRLNLRRSARTIQNNILSTLKLLNKELGGEWYE